MLPFDAKPGNASIAVKDVNGTILWSWHIWVVDFDPELTSHKLKSNAVMMDRNLGALSITPGDIKSYGLTYQWGRKDPFVGGYSDGDQKMVIVPNGATYQVVSSDDNTNSLNFTIANPTIIVDDCNWNNDDSFWTERKTMYDPCPVGWRIPSQSVWEGEYIDTSYGNYEYVILQDSQALYPSTGFIDCGYISDFNNVGHYWTVGRCEMRTHRGWSYFYMGDRSPLDNQRSVRCMKEAPKQSGDNEGYDENEDYEW
jgi:hypothetical protein